jgi:xanthine/uracil permease
VTFEQIVPLLIGLLIGLLVSLIVGGVWSTRTHPRNLSWLTTHDRVMGGLLILAVFALGVFVTYVLLR